MRRKNGFVAQLIYQECFAGRAFCLLKENRKRGQEKDMPLYVVFIPIAESMSDRTAIWRPIRSGRHLTRQKGSIHFLWLICMVEGMWRGLVYNSVGLRGYVNLQIRHWS